MLELIDSVKRVHGAAFEVRMAPRRPGDPAAVVADATLARRELGWAPRYDDLDMIVTNALAWERILAAKNSIHGIETPEPDHRTILDEKSVERS